MDASKAAEIKAGDVVPVTLFEVLDRRLMFRVFRLVKVTPVPSSATISVPVALLMVIPSRTMFPVLSV